MKKLFFAAALAIVAVGAALSSNATIVYPAGSNTSYNCETGVALCSTISPQPLYTVTFSSGNQNATTQFSPGSTRYN